MKKSHRSVHVGLACLLALAACSSSGEPAATTDAGLPPPISEPVQLESEDGVVRLEVPAGSVREGTDLGIDTIDPADVAELDGISPIGAAYRLRPEGLTFPDPLIVRIRVAADETNRADGLPLVLAMIVSEGVVSAEIEGRTTLADTGADAGEREIEHLATIDRFGTLVLVDGGITFDLQPAQVEDLVPGDSFEAALMAQAQPAAFESWPGLDIRARWSAAGAISDQGPDTEEAVSGFGADGSGQEWSIVNEYTCDVVGAGTHSVEIRVDVGGLPNDSGTVQTVILVGESSCGDVGR